MQGCQLLQQSWNGGSAVLLGGSSLPATASSSSLDAATADSPGGSSAQCCDAAGGSIGYPSSIWQQFTALLGRQLLAITRNPFDVAGRCGAASSLALDCEQPAAAVCYCSSSCSCSCTPMMASSCHTTLSPACFLQHRCLTFTWVGIAIGLLYYSTQPTPNLLSLRSRSNLMFACLWFMMLMPYVSMSLYTSDKEFYAADMSGRHLYRPSAYYAAKARAQLSSGAACCGSGLCVSKCACVACKRVVGRPPTLLQCAPAMPRRCWRSCRSRWCARSPFPGLCMAWPGCGPG